MDKIEFGTYNITIFGLKMVVKSGLKTVAFIAGKKNPAIKKKLFVFPLKI